MINVETSSRGSVVYLVADNTITEMVVYSRTYNKASVKLLYLNDLSGKIKPMFNLDLLFATEKEAQEYLETIRFAIPFEINEIVYRLQFNEEFTGKEIVSAKVLQIDTSNGDITVNEIEMVGKFIREKLVVQKACIWSDTEEEAFDKQIKLCEGKFTRVRILEMLKKEKTRLLMKRPEIRKSWEL